MAGADHVAYHDENLSERSEMADREIFCSYEMRAFPATEFKTYAEYGVVHERPADGGPKHTTSGQPLPSEEGAAESWTVPSQAYR